MSSIQDKIKQLCEETGYGIMLCRTALKETNCDYDKAKRWLANKEFENLVSLDERIKQLKTR